MHFPTRKTDHRPCPHCGSRDILRVLEFYYCEQCWKKDKTIGMTQKQVSILKKKTNRKKR